MSKDLKNALRSTRDMDEYLELRSSQEIIDDVKAVAGQGVLRDQLAAKAMPEFIRALYTTIAAGTIECESDEQMMDVAAIKSYAMADAMLKARHPVSTSPERGK